MTKSPAPRPATAHVANQYTMDLIIEKPSKTEVLRRMDEATEARSVLMHDELVVDDDRLSNFTGE